MHSSWVCRTISFLTTPPNHVSHLSPQSCKPQSVSPSNSSHHSSKPPPMTLSPDLLEAKHWIYPLNQEKRDYQYNIVQRCLFDNTIVALPTGLGKTFISGVVMLNCGFIIDLCRSLFTSIFVDYRWFPEGKVVFVAPTKPLVAQQIEACHKTCGIPGSDAIELTGQNPKPMRARAVRVLADYLTETLMTLLVERETRVLHDSSNIHKRSHVGEL